MNQEALNFIQKRTVRVLASGQILSGFGLGSTLSIGALLAADLSGTVAFSGAAATFSTLGAAVWAIPLSRLAFAKGRRIALALGAFLAISGASLVITAASIRLFPLLLVALFLLGAGSATTLQARFAATDIPVSKKVGKDLSLVVWATTIGAVTGPNLFGPGEVVGNLLGLPELTGPFVFTISAQVLATTVFWFGLRPDPLLVAKQVNAEKLSEKPKLSIRSAISTLRRHPVALYAISAIALSHMVMVSVMSMTPVHISSHGGSLVVVGFVISLHILGMYAFAPIFGILSDKIGPVKTIALGQLIYLAALLIAGLGSEEEHLVTIGLFLLGLGWSASTVAGSTLVAVSVPAEQKTNVQGLSDSLMNLSGALGGAVAGTVVSIFAFTGLNFAALAPVSVISVLSIFTWRYRVQRHRLNALASDLYSI
ncbi:MAG: MFS transporter [Actinomycetota bacterium]